MSTVEGAPGEFDLAMQFGPTEVLVAVTGDLDLMTAPDLRSVLNGVLEESHRHVVLDVAKVGFMDAAALGVIAVTAARLRSIGASLTIRAPSPNASQLLDITAVATLVTIEAPDPAAAALGGEQHADDLLSLVASAPVERPMDFARVAALPARHDVLDAALRLVTTLAHATIGGADGVSVSLKRQGTVSTIAASDETIAQMDRDQYATGQGPCLAAAAEGHWFHVESLAEETRWPQFVPRAIEGGINSILSTPLMASDRPVGALNIYSRSEGAFGPDEQELAALFATQASGIVRDAGADVGVEEIAKRLQNALVVREVIAQAQGALMAREGVSAEAASAHLRRSSRQSQVPLRDRAADIVASTQTRSDACEEET